MDDKNMKNKVKFGLEQRGVVLAITLGLCAAPVVGGFFLVKSLIGTTTDQLSNAPSAYYDYESSLPGTPNSNPSPSSSTTVRDTGAINSSGANSEPKPNDHNPLPDTDSDYVMTISSKAADTDADSSAPTVIASYKAYTTKAAPAKTTSAKATSTTPKSTTSRSSTTRTTGSTASSHRGTTASSASGFFDDVQEIEYDPETFEGVIGDYFD